MYETIFNKRGPDQLSYTVRDLEEAAQLFYEVFGAGPFLKMGPMTYDECKYRGEPTNPEIVIALGMWGPMQVELVQKLNDEPMLFDECGIGFNHVNVVVDDYEECMAFMRDKGFPAGQEMIKNGKPVAYIDTACDERIGHHVEVHQGNPTRMLVTLKARELWDGSSPWFDTGEAFKAMMADPEMRKIIEAEEG